MAESATYIVQEEDLICLICLDCWIDKDPRILDCQHTFCYECLHIFQKTDFQIICPTCREKNSIQDINYLKRNLLKSSIVTLKATDNLCKIHKKEGSFYCQTHDIDNICSICYDNEHKECSKITMVKKKENNFKIQEYLNFYENQKSNLLKEIDEKEKEIVLSIQKKFFNVKKEIFEYFNIKKGKFNENLNNVKNQEKNYEDLLDRDQLQIKFSNIDLNYEITNFQINKDSLKKQRNETKFRQELLDFCKIVNLKGNIIFETERNPGPFELILKKLPSFQYMHKENELETSTFIRLKFKSLPKTATVAIRIINYNNLINIVNILKYFPTVKHFEGNFRNQIDDKLFTDLCDSLSSSSNELESFSMKIWCMDGEKCRKIQNLLNFCTKLNKIELYYEPKTDSVLHVIINSFRPSCKILRTINLNFCDIGEKDCKELSKIFNDCSKIENLDIGGNRNMKNGFADIGKSLKKSSKSLKYLNFQYCNLIENQCKDIAFFLKSCSIIENIDLSWNKLMLDGLNDVCKALQKSSKTLRHLDFNNCSLTNEQCKVISGLLIKCHKIETIDLSFNEKCNSGLEYIFESLINSSSTLKGINLTNCSLTNITMLGCMLKKCSNLQIIHLSFNRLSIEHNDQRLFTNLMGSAKSLKALYLANCFDDNYDCRQLISLIRCCKNMEKIVLNTNKSIKFILKDFCENLAQLANSMKELHLIDCNLSEKHLDYIKNILSFQIFI